MRRYEQAMKCVKRIQTTVAIALVCLILQVFLPLPSGAQSEAPFPRLANMWTHGSVAPGDIVSLSKWDLLILNSVWTENQLEQLRGLNPNIKLFLYVCPYCIESPPNLQDDWMQSNYAYAADNDLWWYNNRSAIASDWPQTQMINITDQGALGPQGNWRTYISTRITELMTAHPAVDGIFLDNYWKGLSWNSSLQLDSDCNPTHNPAGCDSVPDTAAELDTLWNRALWDLSRDLRSRFDAAQSSRARPLSIMTNRSDDYFSQINGTLYEFFPSGWIDVDPGNPFGYNWNSEMLSVPQGYLLAPFRSAPYRISVLNADWSGTVDAPNRSDEFERHKRFTMVSSLLGDGYYSLDAGDEIGHGSTWWEPEYDHDSRGKGYLGFPAGGMYRVTVPQGEEIIRNGSFTGSSTEWRSTEFEATGTFTIDTSISHSNPFSARLEVTTKTSPNGSLKLWQSSVPVKRDTTYTFSLWARAVPSAELLVYFFGEQCLRKRCSLTKRFQVSSEWQQYQFSFASTGTAAASVNIFVVEPGVVWLDDISLRQGDASVYRRDFELGSVLLNYTANPVSLELGAAFDRLLIAGSNVFDGATLTHETVPPWDARILLKSTGGQNQKDPDEDTAPPIVPPTLRQNQPNPFNPGTQIQFHLQQGQEVNLSVFDVSGRLVRVLVNRLMIPNVDHTVVWDGRDQYDQPVRSGVYLYRIETATVHETRKMILLR